uniref:Putative amino acid permease YhdG n=1 Tax=Anthurium amnicola TaxID=1678845 RepID=A0A1D1YDP2_9ARAE
MASGGYAFYTSGASKQEEESKWKYHFRKLLTVKTIQSLESDQKVSELKKSLSAFDLTMIGLGGIIGSGIFVLTGNAAAENAGPAVVISFIISGIASAFAALSYSELASMIPVSGSAYTYAYATMGELVGWIIGWDLILEYLVGAATVAAGWSGYFVYFLSTFNVQLAPSWTVAPIAFNQTTQEFMRVPDAYFNLPAFLITFILTVLLIVGIKESATFNSIIVSLKVVVIVIFVLAASTKVDPKNYQPFVPPNEGSFPRYGVTGIFSAATVVFFSYIGFDAVSTTAQEAKNPQRDLPIGIIGSLLVSTVLYVAVCLVLTGVVPYKELNGPAPIAVAVSKTGMRWLGVIVDLGALAGLTSVILISLMGQPRIFYSMAQDGLFPELFGRIHPRFKTPYITISITGIICAVAAAIFPIDVLAELTSVGTLLAFFLVNLGVMVLRIHAPDAPRKFKVPGGPYFVPIVGALLSLLLFATAHKASIERVFIWMAVGLLIYGFYGRTHSKLNNPERRDGGMGEKNIGMTIEDENAKRDDEIHLENA